MRTAWKKSGCFWMCVFIAGLLSRIQVSTFSLRQEFSYCQISEANIVIVKFLLIVINITYSCQYMVTVLLPIVVFALNLLLQQLFVSASRRNCDALQTIRSPNGRPRHSRDSRRSEGRSGRHWTGCVYTLYTFVSCYGIAVLVNSFPSAPRKCLNLMFFHFTTR